MALDATLVAFGEFMLGDGGEEAGGRPTLLVGARGELGPDSLDGGQAQLVEHDPEAGGVDRGGGGRSHAASPSRLS